MNSAKTWTEFTLEDMLFECTDEYKIDRNKGQIINGNGVEVALDSVIKDMKSYYGYEVVKYDEDRFLVNDDNIAV